MTLTIELALYNGNDEQAFQISRFEVISFESYLSDKKTEYT